MKNRIVNTLAVACLLGFSGTHAANAGTIANQTKKSTVVGAAAGSIPPTASVQELEAVLKSSYVGTYAIYGSLPEPKKLALYSSVKQGGNIQDFREQVINKRLNRR